MYEAHTTAAIQRYLDQIGDEPDGSTPLVRELLAGAADRLHLLCASLLHKSYPRLTRPPLNLQSDEMLGAVVERMLKALRQARPGNVRQFFALANQHMRWELNDLARKLDEHTRAVEVSESSVVAPNISNSGLSPNTVRILDAIDRLDAEEREVFDLVRIQGLTHAEVAEMLDVSTKTVQRRLNKSLLSLAQALSDLRPEGDLAVGI